MQIKWKSNQVRVRPKTNLSNLRITWLGRVATTNTVAWLTSTVEKYIPAGCPAVWAVPAWWSPRVAQFARHSRQSADQSPWGPRHQAGLHCCRREDQRTRRRAAESADAGTGGYALIVRQIWMEYFTNDHTPSLYFGAVVYISLPKNMSTLFWIFSPQIFNILSQKIFF